MPTPRIAPPAASPDIALRWRRDRFGGELLWINARLLHRPVVALLLVAGHLLVRLILGGIHVDILGAHRSWVRGQQYGHPRTDHDLLHRRPLALECTSRAERL